ncbi:MAG: hypothetical protein ACJKTH_03185 [Patescibacteria group bacterium UBA2163]
MTHAPQHQGKRKRVKVHCEPYPHPNPLIRGLDYLMMLFGFIIAFGTIPQAWIIWSTQDASNLSLVTWSIFTLNAMVYFVYALVHKEYPILFGSSFLIFIDAFIVLGILIY